MSFKLLHILTIILFLYNNIFSQEINGELTDSISFVDIETSALVGKPKSKAFAISYGLLPKMPITSSSDVAEFDGSDEVIHRLEEIKVSLKVPLLLKKRTKLITDLRYEYEEFNFERNSQLTNPLYTNLQNKHLSSIGAEIYLNQDIRKRNFMVVRLGGRLNGDVDAKEIKTIDALKVTFGGLYGIKKNSTNRYGIGVYFNYSFGRPVIYPTLMWNKWLTNRLLLDALIPAKVTLRYAASEKDIIKTGAFLAGGSYNIAIDDSPFSNMSTLELRRSSIKFKIEYEREIYDFLWFDFKVGYRHPLKFDVAEENTFKKDELIQNELTGNTFFEIGIFIVPPKKLVERYRRRNLD